MYRGSVLLDGDSTASAMNAMTRTITIKVPVGPNGIKELNESSIVMPWLNVL